MNVLVPVAAALGALLLAFVVVRLLAVPAQWLLALAWRMTVGYLALAGLNALGGLWALHLPVNPLSATMVGLLGLPGVVALLIIRRLVSGV